MINQIPVIILAGGLGTRLSEETDKRPKPMVTIGEKPIIWHLMSIFSDQGFTNFKIATGYKHELIDEWVEHNNKSNSWGFKCFVESIFTGDSTMTGGRVKQIMEESESETFLMTYGDGLANINLNSLIDFHHKHKKLATVTSVRPPARFGVITSDNGLVTHFGEKVQTDAGWINGGFFVLSRKVANYVCDSSEAFEQEPMKRLVTRQELMTYQHEGFWQPMDTLREKQILEELAEENPPIWRKILH